MILFFLNILLKYFHSTISQFTNQVNTLSRFQTSNGKYSHRHRQRRCIRASQINLLISVNLARSFSLEGNCQNREIGCTSIPPPSPCSRESIWPPSGNRQSVIFLRGSPIYTNLFDTIERAW